MVIIIDGYNLLKMASSKQVGERERSAFIGQLVAYVRAAGNRIIIVFDGGQDPRPVALHKHGVIVMYAGYKESADTVIKNLLDERAGRETLLVSTDRELNRYGEELDIPSMDSTVFYSYLQHRLHERPSAHASRQTVLRKFDHEEEDPALDMLMEQGARFINHKDEDACKVIEKRSAQKSKIEKRLEQLVKKL